MSSSGDVLRELEESLWRSETRFDREHLEVLLHPDFLEFGQSGRTYDRDEIIAAPFEPLEARLPLAGFQVLQVTPEVHLVTYQSRRVQPDGTDDVSNRSSLWLRTDGRWRLLFHQGTPISR